jgi:hypothetical protein
MKNKLDFYLLSFTWGLPMTLIGLVVAASLFCAGYRPKRWGGCWYYNIGENWGGVNLGLIFLTDNSDSTHTKIHEFGHAVQNCYYGITMPFVVCLPSVIRYWYREIRQRLGFINETAYSDIWFEAEADKLGYENISMWQ